MYLSQVKQRQIEKQPTNSTAHPDTAWYYLLKHICQPSRILFAITYLSTSTQTKINSFYLPGTGSPSPMTENTAKEERKRLAWLFSTTSTEMVCLCPCLSFLSLSLVLSLSLPCVFCLWINLSLPLAVLNIRFLFYSCTLQVSSGMTWRVTMRSQSFAKMSQVKCVP